MNLKNKVLIGRELWIRHRWKLDLEEKSGTICVDEKQYEVPVIVTDYDKLEYFDLWV